MYPEFLRWIGEIEDVLPASSTFSVAKIQNVDSSDSVSTLVTAPTDKAINNIDHLPTAGLPEQEEVYDADESTSSSPATSSSSCSKTSQDGNIGIFDAIYKCLGGKHFAEDDEEGDQVGPAFRRSGRNQYGVHSPAPAWWKVKKAKIDHNPIDDKSLDHGSSKIDSVGAINKDIDRVKKTEEFKPNTDVPRYRGYEFEYGYYCPVWVKEDSPDYSYWPKGDPLPIVWDLELRMWTTWEPRQNWPTVTRLQRDMIISQVLEFWFTILRGSDDEDDDDDDDEDATESELDMSIEYGSEDEVLTGLMEKVKRYREMYENKQVSQAQA